MSQLSNSSGASGSNHSSADDDNDSIEGNDHPMMWAI